MDEKKLFDFIEKDQVVRMVSFLGKEADTNIKNEQGLTALMYAAVNDSVKVIAILIAPQYNGEVNAQDEQGLTALMHACKLGYVKSVAILLKAKDCDVSIVDKSGKTAKEHAEISGDKKTIALFNKLAK